MPPEKYEQKVSENNEKIPEIENYKDIYDNYQKDILINANLGKFIDEAFYTRKQSIDHRVQEGLVKYIAEWKMKSWENEEYEELIKERINVPWQWKLKYLYDNSDKDLYTNIINIRKRMGGWNVTRDSLIVTTASEVSSPDAQEWTPDVAKTDTNDYMKYESNLPDSRKAIVSEQDNDQTETEDYWFYWNEWEETSEDDQDVESTLENASDWNLSFEWVPKELIPTFWVMFNQAEDWEWVKYRLGWQSKSWIDCSAFVSRLLSFANWWNYKHLTTKTLPGVCVKLKDPNHLNWKPSKQFLASEVRAWDLQFTPWHVEMITSKPYKKNNGRWYVKTIWSASKTRPMDKDGNIIPTRRWWVWFRERELSSNIQRPNIFDVA